MLIDEVASHFDVKKKGNGYQGRCPAHESTSGNSLTINAGDDGRILVRCFGSCPTEKIVNTAGLSMSDLFAPRDGYHNGNGHESRSVAVKPACASFSTALAAIKSLSYVGTQAGSWTYHDSNGDAVAVVVRFDNADGSKEFRPVSIHGGKWHIKGPKEPRTLYRLDTVAGESVVYVTEGEKAADAARSIGLGATTSMGGARAPTKTDWSPVKGKSVVILPDNDEPGAKYAETVSGLCIAAGCRSVKIVKLPGLPPGGDIVEWIEELHGDAAEPVSMREEIEALTATVEAVQVEAVALVHDLLPHAVIRRMSEVQPIPLEWLWPGRFPLGKISLVAGDPGLGKSFLTMDIAARITRGEPWPDDSSVRSTAGSVMIFNSEDDIADTIRPRLDDAGADVEKVYFVEGVVSYDPTTKQKRSRGFSLDVDLPFLAKWLQTTPDSRAIFIDPISAYCGGTDSHKNAEVRAMLSPLAELAARHRVAVVCVTHLAKGNGTKAVYRAMGSLAFAAAARAVWSVNRDLDDPDRRLLLPAKMNLCRETNGMAYRIVDGRIHWEASPVEMTADDYLQHESSQATESLTAKSARDEAIEWLREALAGGDKASKEILADGKENGHTEKMLRKSLKAIGGRAVKTGFEGGWLWSLGSAEDGRLSPEDAEDSHTQREGILASSRASSQEVTW